MAEFSWSTEERMAGNGRCNWKIDWDQKEENLELQLFNPWANQCG